MKILFLPIAVIFVPLLLLGFVLKYWKQSRSFSIGWKIALGLTSFTIGILASIFATFISIKGMLGAGIKCVTGAIIFVPLGLIIHVLGVPFLFFYIAQLSKEGNKPMES